MNKNTDNNKDNSRDRINWTPIGGAPLIRSELAPNFKALLKQASENLTPVVLNFGTVNYLALICDVHEDYFTWIYAKEKGVLFKSANKYEELVQVIFAATDWTATSSLPVTGVQVLNYVYDSNDDVDQKEEHSESSNNKDVNFLLVDEEVSLENYWDYFSDPPPAEEDLDDDDSDLV
jgi:hypothetical protein